MAARITRYDYLHDANFNVVAMVTGTTSFNVVERYHYSPYGEVTILNGPSDLVDDTGDWTLDADQVSDIGNEFLYTGRRLDSETGLQYSRNRFYHQQLGRWVNRDPLIFIDGYNLYEYVKGMPVSRMDPTGEKSWKECLEALEGLADAPIPTGNPPSISDLEALLRWAKRHASDKMDDILKCLSDDPDSCANAVTAAKNTQQRNVQRRQEQGKKDPGRQRGRGNRGGRGRSGKVRISVVKYLFLLSCEAKCGLVYNNCLKKANDEYDRCLKKANALPADLRESQLGACNLIVNADLTGCAATYAACGLGCLLPVEAVGEDPELH